MLYRFSRLNLLGVFCSPAFVFDLVVTTFFRVSFPSVIFSYFQSIDDSCCWFRNRLAANGLLPWCKIRAPFVTLSAGQDLEGRTHCCFRLSSRVERLTFLWGMTRTIWKINTCLRLYLVQQQIYILTNNGRSSDRVSEMLPARVNDWESQW